MAYKIEYKDEAKENYKTLIKLKNEIALRKIDKLVENICKTPKSGIG